MTDTSITNLFNQWQDYRHNAWKEIRDTDKLMTGLIKIENNLVKQSPNNQSDAFIMLKFIHILWWKSLEYYPLKGQLLNMDKAFRNTLRYLKRQIPS